MDNLKKKSYKAFGWDFIGRLGSQGIGFIISVILARLLLPDDFGLLAMINIVVIVANVFMDMGLGVSLIQRKDVRDEHYGTVMFLNIGTGALMSVILFLSSGFIADFFNKEQLKLISRAMSSVIFISSFGNVIRAKLRKELNYAVLTKTTWIGASVSGVVGIVMAFMGYGVWSLVFQSILNPLITNLSLYYLERWRPKIIFSIQALKDLWGYGFNMFLSSVIDVIFAQIDSLIIGKISTPAQLGFYYRAASFKLLVERYSSGSINSIAFPLFSQLQDNREAYNKAVFSIVNVVCFLSFFIAGLLYIVADDLFIILFTDKWAQSIPMFKIMLWASFAPTVGSILINVISSLGNSRLYLILSIIKKIIILGAFFVGYHYGIFPLLYAMFVTTTIYYFLNVYAASKVMNVSSMNFLKPTFLSAIIAVGIIAVLIYIDRLTGLTNHFARLIMYSVLFVVFYLFSNQLFRVEGWNYVKNEIRIIIERKKTK